MASPSTEPEIYYFVQTPFVPNSRLPVLIYRGVLSHPIKDERARDFLEGNHWTQGGAWGAVPRHHFHPNTHECYAVVRGSSTLLFGVGPSEDVSGGRLVQVTAGDVIIIPAGVSHCSADFQDGYFYLGLYPNNAPKWKNEYCRDAERSESLRSEAESVVIPEWDPVRGFQGPLYHIWTSSNRLVS